jgi:hypothetical protein
MRPAHLDAVRELAAELEQDWPAKLAELERSGVPLNAKHPLLATVEKIDGELTGPPHRRRREAWQVAGGRGRRRRGDAAGETVGPTTRRSRRSSRPARPTARPSTRSPPETVKAGLVEQMAQARASPRPAATAPATATATSPPPRAPRRRLIRTRGPARARASASPRATSTSRLAEPARSRAARSATSRSARAQPRRAQGRAHHRRRPGSAGAFVTPDRQGYYPLPLRPLTVLDLITIGQTDSDLVEYVRMLSLTNAAAETAEAISAAPIDGTTVTAVQGGRKPESGMTFDVVQEAVSTIAHWVPATKRALSRRRPAADDHRRRAPLGPRRSPRAPDRRRQRRRREPPGHPQPARNQQRRRRRRPKPATRRQDPPRHHPDPARRLRATGVLSTRSTPRPSGSRASSGGAGTGGYLFGAPEQPGPADPLGPPRRRVAGDPAGHRPRRRLQAAILWLREGTQVLASDSHEDFFTRNLVAVLAEMRAGFGVPTPAAFARSTSP